MELPSLLEGMRRRNPTSSNFSLFSANEIEKRALFFCLGVFFSCMGVFNRGLLSANESTRGLRFSVEVVPFHGHLDWKIGRLRSSIMMTPTLTSVHTPPLLKWLNLLSHLF